MTTIRTSLPTEAQFAWLVKNIGPRTHWTAYSIGGEGWRFKRSQGMIGNSWKLEIDDEKMLTYYLLVR